MFFVALALILVGVAYRIAAVHDLGLSNFSPLMAIAFCGAVYFRKRLMWVIAFVALSLSDVYINNYYARAYGFHWPVSGFIARTVCFAAVIALGLWVSRRKSWLWLLNGSLLGAVLFYFVTNTQSWMSDAFYPKTLAGWWQALTIGHPEYPPTIYFFRNTLFGDLMYTGLFAGLMEWLAHRKGEPSLLDNEEGDESEAVPEETKSSES